MTETTTLDAATPDTGDGLAFVREVGQLGRSLARVREGGGPPARPTPYGCNTKKPE